jgi:hypothetical protein
MPLKLARTRGYAATPYFEIGPRSDPLRELVPGRSLRLCVRARADWFHAAQARVAVCMTREARACERSSVSPKMVVRGELTGRR